MKLHLIGWFGRAAVLDHVCHPAQAADHPVGIQAIEDLLPDLLAAQDAGILQHFQMVRDGRTADMKMAGDVGDVHGLTLPEQQDDLQARRVADSVQ